MLIKRRRHLIFSLQLEVDDVVRWEESHVPMLYSEAPSGELRPIMVTWKLYRIPRKMQKKTYFPRKENILQYYKIVIHILDSIYGLIYTAWVHITTRLTPRGHLSASRVYEPIYPVKNIYIYI